MPAQSLFLWRKSSYLRKTLLFIALLLPGLAFAQMADRLMVRFKSLAVRRSNSILLTEPGTAVWCFLPNGRTISDHADHESVGWVPQEILNRPLSLRDGIGPYQETVTTSSALAQNFYNQGVAYLHSYVWIEAARSFHQALRIDPKMGMAYVGLSYAYSPMDYVAARAALAQAESLSGGLTELEQSRIHIRALQLDAMVDPASATKLSAFRQAIDDSLAVHPDDVELLLLRGQAAEPTPFGDGQGCVPSAVPYYQKALALAPSNFAAHHFLTHCYENQGKFAQALEEARVYAQLSPQIPHAQHMVGHELRCIGRTDEAIDFFLKADALENAYYRRENLPPAMDWHHAHNLSLLASAYQYEGQLRKAELYFREEGQLTPFTEYAAFNRKDWPEFLLNRGDFARALVASEQMTQSPSPLARATGHALAAAALVGMHRPEQASAQLEAASTEAQTLSKPDANTVSPYLDISQLAILFARGPMTDAMPVVQRVERYVRAATSADSWSQGLFRIELLASLAREHDHWEIAAELSDFMLSVDPYYGGSHYAAAVVARHAKDSTTAQQEFSAAEKYWNHADKEFPELVDTKKALSMLRLEPPETP